MSEEELTPLQRKAVANLVDHMADDFDRIDAAEPHCLLVTDPSTGQRHVVGVWENRLQAKIAIALHQAANAKVDPELANIVYEPLVFIEDDLHNDPRRHGEAP